MSLTHGKAELRRVQRLGGSSLVVTIPKHWARRVNIKPGDDVAVIDEGESLKIIPASRDSNDHAVILRIKINNTILSFGPSRVVYCAYALGYAGVSFEWNPRSIKVDLEGLIAEVEDNPLVLDVVEARQGRVTVMFRGGDSDHSLHLRALGALLSSILSGSTDGDTESKVEPLVASILRGRLCNGATSGLLLAPIADLMVEVARHSGEADASVKSVLERLSRLAIEIAGGASVGSVKRLSNAIKELESLEEEVKRGDTRLHGIVEAMLIVLKRLSIQAACEAIASSNDNA